jgi:hypothetical protein
MLLAAAAEAKRWAAPHSMTVELIVAKHIEEIRRLNVHVRSAAQQLIQPDCSTAILSSLNSSIW